MTKVQGLQTILDMGLPDQAIQSDEIPWVPQGERVWFKPLRFDLANGRWVNVLKVTGGGKVNRHRHSGGQVLASASRGTGTTPSASGRHAPARLCTSRPAIFTR